MKFKRIMSLVISAVLAVTLCGCNNNNKPSDSSDGASVSEPVQSTDSNSESTPEKEQRNDPMNITSAKELVAQMKVGWKLGNTLDSTRGRRRGDLVG